jgi:hypothetical protein
MRGISLLTMAMLGLLVAGAAPGSSPTAPPAAPPAAAAEASPVHLIVGRSPASDEEVEVVFQNVSADDLWIYLGSCDGGGFFPYQLTFTVTEGDRVMKGHFFDPKHVNVGGRVDAYIVPLRSGSSYSLRIRFAHMIHYQVDVPARVFSPLLEHGAPLRPTLLTVEWDAPAMKTYPATWPGHLVSNSLSLGPRPN